MKPLVGPLLPACSSVKTWVKLQLLGSLSCLIFPWNPSDCAILVWTATPQSEVQDTLLPHLDPWLPPRVSLMSVSWHGAAKCPVNGQNAPKVLPACPHPSHLFVADLTPPSSRLPKAHRASAHACLESCAFHTGKRDGH